MKKWNPEPGRISFNPRTPCGVRLVFCLVPHGLLRFQSTHSLRSATLCLDLMTPHLGVSIHALLAECDGPLLVSLRARLRFNPRTPCGVRRNSSTIFPPLAGVSIHALLAECDHRQMPGCRQQAGFNPRTPCGVRPSSAGHGCGAICVSIHALLAECDDKERAAQAQKEGFNPRTPCGVRRLFCAIVTAS